ncbi:MAG: hypothetical protein NTU53_03120, partial [Planctomycetota bacterium]|nr:hypothetical protein [Planctomycetota bacterium]
MSGMRRVGMVVVLLMVGVGLWVGIGGGAKEWEEQLMMLAVPAAVLALGVLPPVRRVGVEIVE